MLLHNAIAFELVSLISLLDSADIRRITCIRAPRIFCIQFRNSQLNQRMNRFISANHCRFLKSQDTLFPAFALLKMAVVHLYSVLNLLWILCNGACINFLQFCLYCLVRPFNKVLYRQIMGYALFFCQCGIDHHSVFSSTHIYHHSFLAVRWHNHSGLM